MHWWRCWTTLLYRYRSLRSIIHALRHDHRPVMSRTFWSYVLASEQARMTHLAIANFRLCTCYHNQTLKVDENESKRALFPVDLMCPNVFVLALLFSLPMSKHSLYLCRSLHLNFSAPPLPYSPESRFSSPSTHWWISRVCPRPQLLCFLLSKDPDIGMKTFPWRRSK